MLLLIQVTAYYLSLLLYHYLFFALSHFDYKRLHRNFFFFLVNPLPPHPQVRY